MQEQLLLLNRKMIQEQHEQFSQEEKRENK